MPIIRLVAGTIALCTLASPVFAQMAVCMTGEAGATLNTWLQSKGQTPLLRMDIRIGETEYMSAMVAVSPTGDFAILYKSPEGVTCLMGVGKNARPAGASTEPAEPLKREEAL